jgi:hypothetical protein
MRGIYAVLANGMAHVDACEAYDRDQNAASSGKKLTADPGEAAERSSASAPKDNGLPWTRQLYDVRLSESELALALRNISRRGVA